MANTNSNGNDDCPDMEYINFMSKENPSDMGLFNADIDNKLKKMLIDFGTCRPNGSFPKDEAQKNRSFSDSYYHTISKAGLSIEVSWLAYSPRLDCAYCEPCWLFADRSDPHFHPAWSNGVRKWKELSQKNQTSLVLKNTYSFVHDFGTMEKAQNNPRSFRCYF